jgi:hypothetical protein
MVFGRADLAIDVAENYYNKTNATNQMISALQAAAIPRIAIYDIGLCSSQWFQIYLG